MQDSQAACVLNRCLVGLGAQVSLEYMGGVVTILPHQNKNMALYFNWYCSKIGKIDHGQGKFLVRVQVGSPNKWEYGVTVARVAPNHLVRVQILILLPIKYAWVAQCGKSAGLKNQRSMVQFHLCPPYYMSA